MKTEHVLFVGLFVLFVIVDILISRFRKKRVLLCRGGEPHLWTKFEPVQHHRTGDWRHCKRCGVEQRSTRR